MLQVKAMLSIHLENGTATYPMMVSTDFSITLPSFISTRTGSLQSRQGASMVTVFPGKIQLTARDSNPHCPNHFCLPSTEIRYWVGRLLNGAKLPM